jgi:hypothetical protein
VFLRRSPGCGANELNSDVHCAALLSPAVSASAIG